MRTRTQRSLLAAVALSAGLICASVAQAAPQITSTSIDGPVAGKPVELRIGARDPDGPVTGMMVGFGRGEGGFGLSNCMPPDSAGRVQAAPGQRVTLAAPHQYARAGAHSVAARLSSAGCTGGMAGTLQEVGVTVVPADAVPQPPVVKPPVLLPLGQPNPVLPGLGRLPISRIDLPLPAVPGLPGLSRSHAAGAPIAVLAAQCPRAGDLYRNTKAGNRKAKRSLLCLVNAERTRRGLRSIRANRRLVQAAVGHSRAMVARRFFAHVGPGSVNLQARLRSARYIPPRGGTWVIGENIGFGQGRLASPLAMHRAWMHSTPHRMAMLNRSFREVGYGIWPGAPVGSRGATYTSDFGTVR